MKQPKSLTFSSRPNAKRAAEKAIDDGTAPSIAYSLHSREDGRVEIVWHSNGETEEVPTTEEVEEEIATATVEADRLLMVADIIASGFATLGSVTPLPTEKLERRPRAAPSGDRKPSKNAEMDAAAARGEMPAKPVMTSKTNKEQYQKRFDKLEALAQAGDWDGVRAYEVKGINSYAKMVAAYRDRLLAAQEAKTEAA